MDTSGKGAALELHRDTLNVSELTFAESAIVKDESLYAPGPHLGSTSGKDHAMPMDDPTETL